MGNQIVVEGEIETVADQSDPDLNAAWWAFRDQIDQEANSGGSISVFEVPVDANGVPRPRTQMKTKLFSVPVGALSFDDVLDRVIKGFMEPGAIMTVQIMGRIDGQRGLAMNKMVRLRREKETAVIPAQGEMAQVLRALMEQGSRDRAETRALMETILNRQHATPAIDPLSMMEKMANVAAILKGNPAAPGAALGSNGVPADPMQAMTHMMMTMMFKKFFSDMDKGGGAAPAASANGGDLKEIISGIASVAAPWVQKLAADSQANVLRERRALGHTPEPVAQPAQSTHGETTQDTTQEAQTRSPEEAKMELLKQLKEGLPNLCEMAANKSKVADVVKLVCASMPEDAALDDALYTLLSDDGCVDQLIAIEPRVANFPEWFEEFRQGMLTEFNPDTPA